MPQRRAGEAQGTERGYRRRRAQRGAAEPRGGRKGAGERRQSRPHSGEQRSGDPASPMVLRCIVPVKECLGWHSECRTRRVPTLRISTAHRTNQVAATFGRPRIASPGVFVCMHVASLCISLTF